MRCCLILVVSACLCCIADAQSPGNGVSKSTYACDDPIPGKNFMYKYFPVGTPGDECTNDVCDCGTWEILQGRVYTLESSDGRLLGPAGNGFGMHLVNVSASRTTGGMSTAEVEEQFTTKLGDMSSFDAFMDFNVMFYTTGLSAYASTFKSDSVPFYTTTWQYQGKTWTSLFVHVPNTQLIIELCQDTALDNTLAASSNTHTTPRASPHSLDRVLAMVQPLEAHQATTGAILTPLAVNRATSASAFEQLEEFYVDGMGTTMKENTTTSEYARKCFLWPGSSVDICFYHRSDSKTKGQFKVGNFEDMLNTVHKNIIGANPICNRDKWTDNHYAIDSFSADSSKILSYIEEKKPFHYCESGGGGGSSGWGASLHYVCDPTGWCIQLDMQFSSAPSDCSTTMPASLYASRKLLQGGNPQCTAYC